MRPSHAIALLSTVALSSGPMPNVQTAARGKHNRFGSSGHNMAAHNAKNAAKRVRRNRIARKSRKVNR